MQVFYEAGVKMSFSLKFIDPGLLLVIEENLIFWKILLIFQKAIVRPVDKTVILRALLVSVSRNYLLNYFIDKTTTSC